MFCLSVNYILTITICLGISKELGLQQPEKPMLVPRIQMQMSKDINAYKTSKLSKPNEPDQPPEIQPKKGVRF